MSEEKKHPTPQQKTPSPLFGSDADSDSSTSVLDSLLPSGPGNDLLGDLFGDIGAPLTPAPTPDAPVLVSEETPAPEEPITLTEPEVNEVASEVNEVASEAVAIEEAPAQDVSEVSAPDDVVGPGHVDDDMFGPTEKTETLSEEEAAALPVTTASEGLVIPSASEEVEVVVTPTPPQESLSVDDLDAFLVDEDALSDVDASSDALDGISLEPPASNLTLLDPEPKQDEHKEVELMGENPFVSDVDESPQTLDEESTTAPPPQEDMRSTLMFGMPMPTIEAIEQAKRAADEAAKVEEQRVNTATGTGEFGAVEVSSTAPDVEDDVPETLQPENAVSQDEGALTNPGGVGRQTIVFGAEDILQAAEDIQKERQSAEVDALVENPFKIDLPDTSHLAPSANANMTLQGGSSAISVHAPEEESSHTLEGETFHGDDESVGQTEGKVTSVSVFGEDAHLSDHGVVTSFKKTMLDGVEEDDEVVPGAALATTLEKPLPSQEETKEPPLFAPTDMPAKVEGGAPGQSSVLPAALRTTILPRVEITKKGPTLVKEDKERYQRIRPLGEGGVAEVELVKDNDINREVAVKRLKRKLHAPANVVRFVDEIKTVGSLEHPNIVPIHDVGIDEKGHYFFVMKYVQGETLEDIITKLRAGDKDYHERFSFSYRTQIFLEILNAVEFAHAQGIIHRDIKPANVMIGPFGEVMVMDWGIAKQIRAPEKTGLIEGASEGTSTDTQRVFQTRNDTLIGTPAYMSPEQAIAKNDELDERSDIYSLSVLFYEFLTLQHYLGHKKTLEEVLFGVVQEKPVPPINVKSPHQDTLPAELHHILTHGMEKELSKRYKTIKELRKDIQMYLGGETKVECMVTMHKSMGNKFVKWMNNNFFAYLTTMIFLSIFVISGGVQIVSWILGLLG